MSAMGQKQKSRLSRRMSALAPKADIGSDMAHVCFVPTAVVTTSARPQGRCSVVVELRVRDMDAFCTENMHQLFRNSRGGGFDEIRHHWRRLGARACGAFCKRDARPGRGAT